MLRNRLCLSVFLWRVVRVEQALSILHHKLLVVVMLGSPRCHNSQWVLTGYRTNHRQDSLGVTADCDGEASGTRSEHKGCRMGRFDMIWMEYAWLNANSPSHTGFVRCKRFVFNLVWRRGSIYFSCMKPRLMTAVHSDGGLSCYLRNCSLVIGNHSKRVILHRIQDMI